MSTFTVVSALTFSKLHAVSRLVAFWFTSFASVGFSLSLVMVSAVRHTTISFLNCM